MSVDEPTLKRQFAREWLKRPTDVYAAAMQVYPADCGRALVVSREWPADPEVLQYRADELDEHGAEAFLPDVVEQSREVYALAMSVAVDPKDRLGFHKLYAELRGFVKAGGGVVVNNTSLVDNRKVMYVTNHGTNDEWEAKLQKQQAALVHDAARPIN